MRRSLGRTRWPKQQLPGLPEVSHSDTLIRKAASDAGFDIKTGLVEGWLGFAVSGAPIKAWVRGMDRCLYLSLSSPAVLNEMPGRAADGGPSTQSPAG